MADTLKEELEERARHIPKIQVGAGNRYGVFAGNGKYENVDPETGLKLLLTPQEWDDRWKTYADQKEAERQAKREAEEEKKREDAKKLVAALPKSQTWIRGADKARKVLGRNNMVGKVLRNHDVVSDGGIIIPACARETDKDFDEIMFKSTFIEVWAVSDWVDKREYPWLWQAKRTIERGGRGPIVEIHPGAGTARRGENGEACLFINAQFCWLEFPHPLEDQFRPKGTLSKLFGFLRNFRGNGSNGRVGWRA